MSNKIGNLEPKGEVLHTFEDGVITLPPPSERVIHQPVWIDVRCGWCRTMNVIGQDTLVRSCFVCGHSINQE